MARPRLQRGRSWGLIPHQTFVYTLMLLCPMSSPQMMTMFGLSFTATGTAIQNRKTAYQKPEPFRLSHSFSPFLFVFLLHRHITIQSPDGIIFNPWRGSPPLSKLTDLLNVLSSGTISIWECLKMPASSISRPLSHTPRPSVRSARQSGLRPFWTAFEHSSFS